MTCCGLRKYMYVKNFCHYIMQMNEMEFHKKYIKYKTKYLDLKMMGGNTKEISQALYTLMGQGTNSLVYIPQEDFSNASLEEILRKYDLENNLEPYVPADPDRPQWLIDLLGNDEPNMAELRQTLLDFSLKNEKIYTTTNDPYIKYSHINNLLALLQGAKNIIKKSFLPIDGVDYSTYHQRHDEQLSRIFSYNYLKQIVTDNPDLYPNIKFPERVMIIKYAGSVLSRSETSKYVDDNLKLYINNRMGYYYLTIENPHNYECIICSTYIKRDLETWVNLAATKQIRNLCRVAPFDAGGDNIFKVGEDLYIVDGKNKGGDSKLCLRNIGGID